MPEPPELIEFPSDVDANYSRPNASHVSGNLIQEVPVPRHALWHHLINMSDN